MSFQERLQAHWRTLDETLAADFVAQIDEIAKDAPPAISAFERACARASTGQSALAVPPYREALRIGLIGERRRRAVIQLSSSLRIAGRAEHATLRSFRDAVSAVLGLTLASLGRERQAVCVLLTALVPPARSMANYAKLLSAD